MMSTAIGDRFRSVTSNSQLQALALGAAAGVCSFAALQIFIRSYRRAVHVHTESIEEEHVPPDTEQTPEIITYSANVANDAREGASDKEVTFDSLGDELRLLRRAEAVLAHRTDRLLLVLDRCNSHSQEQEVLRTCECLGIQNVWLIGPHTEASVPEASIPNSPAGSRSPSRASGESPVRDPACWLSLRRFQSGSECVSALQEDQREIWATDLSQTAERLDLVLQQCGVSGRESGGTVNGGSTEISSQMPARLAVVLGGSEAEGVSRELLFAAHRRVYLPLHGMTESLDVSSTLSIVAHQIRGAWSADELRLPDQEIQDLRERWYAELAGRDESAQAWFNSHVESPPDAISDLRLPESLRESIIAPARKVRQRREILGKQIAGARRPQTFGLTSSSSPASSQPINSDGDQNTTSPALSLTREPQSSFRETSISPVPSAAEFQPGQRGDKPGNGEQAPPPQTDAASEQSIPGDDGLASSTYETDRLIPVTARANGPQMQQENMSATVIQQRRRPWLTQPQ